MAQINWANTSGLLSSSFFTNPLAWTGLTVPGPSDDAILGAGNYTVLAQTGVLVGNDTINGIQVGAGVTLLLEGGLDVLGLLPFNTIFTATNGGSNAGTIRITNNIFPVLIDGLISTTSTFQLGGTFTNTGVIEIDGKEHLLNISSPDEYSILRFAASTVLSGGGKVIMSSVGVNRITGAAGAVFTNVNNKIMGAGTIGDRLLTINNEAQGVIDATYSTPIDLQTPGHVLSNAGLLEATGGGRLIITGTTVDDSAGGTITAGVGSSVTVRGVDVIGGALTSGGSGRIRANGAGNILDGRTSSVTTSAQIIVGAASTLTVEGTIDNSGAISLLGAGSGTQAASLVVGSGGVTLTGRGRIALGSTGVGIVVGATSTSTLTNYDNRFIGSGLLGDGKMILVNEARGHIYSIKAGLLTINTGSQMITNAGVIQSGGGGLTITSAIDNTGILRSVVGAFTVSGAVSGSGHIAIYGGDITVGSVFTQDVAFRRSTGTVTFDNSQGYTGRVLGFSHAGGTVLDLRDIAFGSGTTEAFSKGVLTVTDGVHTANIRMSGSFTTADFKLATDGHGGTNITDPPSSAAAHFTAAMASLGAGSSATSHIAATLANLRPNLLAVPGLHA